MTTGLHCCCLPHSIVPDLPLRHTPSPSLHHPHHPSITLTFSPSPSPSPHHPHHPSITLTSSHFTFHHLICLFPISLAWLFPISPHLPLPHLPHLPLPHLPHLPLPTSLHCLFLPLSRQVLGQGKKLSPKELYDKIGNPTTFDIAVAL